MLTIMTKRRWSVFWNLLRRWFKRELDRSVATILAALPQEASEQEIDNIFTE